MYNLLMVDENLNRIKDLANEILSEISSVKLIKIATDGYEMYNYLKNEHIDIILMNLEMKKVSESEVIKKIYKNKLLYYPRIIIILNEDDEIKYSNFSDYNVIKCIHTNKEINRITQSIIEILSKLTEENKKEEWNICVSKELLKLNYNFKYKGTKYIKECITYLLCKNDKSLINNFERNVYTYIAELHKKSVENIKSNIVKATNNMYLECDINYLLEYFGYKEDTKPTPKLVISTIFDKLNKKDLNGKS